MHQLFDLHAPYQPMGDQPQAIRELVDGVRAGNRHQVLLGATGTGKTFTMANIIQELQIPAVVMAHNKTLAAQLYAEFKEFFPNNAVEYFVSYYDYYQPEAYVPRRDLYIEKEVDTNDEIDRLRLAATAALSSRSDVIIIASVSCIYGLGDPEAYGKAVITLKTGEVHRRNALLRNLIAMNGTTWIFTPGRFAFAAIRSIFIRLTRIRSCTGFLISTTRSKKLPRLIRLPGRFFA